MSVHELADAGYVTDMDSGLRIDMWECQRCHVVYSSDYPPLDECAGEPSELTLAIRSLTVGMADVIEEALRDG